MSSENQQLTVVSTPTGLPKESDFKLETIPTPQESDLKENEFIVQIKYVSVDPYLRGVLRTHPVGKPLTSGAVGEVIATKNTNFPKGSHVQGYMPWVKYTVLNGAPPTRKLDESLPIQTALGVLGMPGMTAYFGLFDVASLKDGDVVFVSGAAGAVGSLVGQLAKLKGHTVIGSAGGRDKCKHVVEDLGFDACIDYKEFKTAAEVKTELDRLAPKGIDVYFENTGGHVTDAVFDVLNKFARVAVCGQIAMYNTTEATPLAPLIFHKLIYKSIRVQGFVVSDFAARAAEFFKYTGPLVAKGAIKYRETVVKGFDQIPHTFIGLFHGANTGKAIVQV